VEDGSDSSDEQTTKHEREMMGEWRMKEDGMEALGKVLGELS
jgi:hypothetical protein